MNFGVYKPGQGYWVRMLTAVFAGALVLSGALWAWAQATRYVPPTPTWKLSFVAVEGTLAEGVQVDFYEPTTDLDAAAGELRLIGTAKVDSFAVGDARTASAVVSSVRLTEGATLLSATRAVVEDIVGQGSPFTAEIPKAGATGIKAFDVIYVQAAVAGVILLLGAVLTFIFVASKRRTVDFLIATDGEMKKVNWSTRKEVQGSTMVVVIASLMLAFTIFAVDYGFGAFFKLIGVLQS